jgi:pyruvate formate lyase activating enzyme
MLLWPTALTCLQEWRGELDGVVFKGGEPTSQEGLAMAIQQVRDLGLAVCLHTTGACPNRLAQLLPLLDRVQLQLKGPFSAYPRITGEPGSGAAAAASLHLLKASGTPFEVRATTHPALLTVGEMDLLRSQLAEAGVTDVRRLPLCPTDRPPAPGVTIWATGSASTGTTAHP